MLIIVKNKDTLLYNDFKFKCVVGKKGTTTNKIEGDFKTPRGIFRLGPLYFRKDRVSIPLSKLNKLQIKKNMGWCDDINSKFYNKPIRVKKKIRCERLFRKDKIYDLLIPIKYNTIRPKRNKGSAIFLHLTHNYKKTQGCIAIKKKDMLILLKLIDKKTKIKII